MDIDPTPLEETSPSVVKPPTVKVYGREYGTTWMKGIGSQDYMFAYTNATMRRDDNAGRIVYYSRQYGWTNYSTGEYETSFMYGAYPDPKTAFQRISLVPPSQQNFFEIMKEGEPAKPFLDLDKTPLPSPDEQLAVIQKLTTAICTVFANSYHIQLEDKHFQWSRTIYPYKFSLHLTIHIEQHDEKVVCFRNNYQAIHLLHEILKLYPELSEYLDQSVFSKHRSMRQLGSTKSSPTGVANLLLIDSDQQVRPRDDHDLKFPWSYETFSKACITWLPADESQLVFLPLPDKWVYGNAAFRAIGPSKKTRTKENLDPGVFTDTKKSFVFGRIVEELLKYHPSLIIPNRLAAEHFTENGEIKFDYSDRTGPCVTGSGKSHQRFLINISVTKGDDIYVRCYSKHCPNYPVFLLTVEPQIVEWKQNVIPVNVPYTSDIITHPHTEPIIEKFYRKGWSTSDNKFQLNAF